MAPERNGNGVPIRDWVERLQDDNEKQRQRAWAALNDLEQRVRVLERAEGETGGERRAKRRLYAVGFAGATVFIAAISLIVNVIQAAL